MNALVFWLLTIGFPLGQFVFVCSQSDTSQFNLFVGLLAGRGPCPARACAVANRASARAWSRNGESMALPESLWGGRITDAQHTMAVTAGDRRRVRPSRSSLVVFFLEVLSS